MRKSFSLYNGGYQSANAFPSYSTAELERDLCSPSLDDETRVKIETEIARRAAKKPRRRTS